jgi:hypothetical protein
MLVYLGAAVAAAAGASLDIIIYTCEKLSFGF